MVLDALARAAESGVPVVRASRVDEGLVDRNVEVDDDALGLVAARYQGRWPDKVISGVTLSTISLPEFVAAYFVIFLLTQVFPIFQPVAMVFPGMGFWDRLQAVALPVIVLVLVVLAHMMRMTRAAILNVMQSAYIETAELKGLSPMRVIWRHALPNAVAPIVSVVVLNLAYLVVGVVVVEGVFGPAGGAGGGTDLCGRVYRAEHSGRCHFHHRQSATEAPEMRMPLSAIIGLVLTGGFLFCALFAQIIAPYPVDAILGGVWEPPSAQFWLGTDTIGRDILSRMIHGGQITIFVALAASLLSFGLGSFLGFLAAVRGGWIDQTLSRTVDLVMAIPSLIVALVVLSVLPINLTVLIVVMGLLDSTRVFRLSRAVAMDIVVMDYVEAARLRGEGQSWIIFREILPNALSPLVAEFGLRFIFAVLFISTLSFLGLGIQPPLADWGGMVKENKDGLVYGKAAALMPALAIAVLAISVNLVADWILSRTTSLKGGRGG